MQRAALALSLVLLSPAAFAADSEVSVARGSHVAIIGGCHDCHTDGYAQTGGKVDPATALTGSPVGFQGPWGTTYAANLRITAARMSEDEWVKYGHSFQTRPPMPWFNLHAMTEPELRSLHQYIKSLGAPGKPAPEAVGPGEAPQTPYIVFAPPTMPGQK